jgi:hypothetical protein
MSALDEQEIAVLAELKTSDPALYRKIRAEALRSAAKLHPDIVVPEVEMGNAIDQLRADQDKTLGEMRTQLEAERAARAKAEAVASAREKHGLAPAEIGQVETFMADNKIDDFDAGVRFMRLQQSQSAQTKNGVPTSGMMEFSASFGDALKDRRGTRRRNLFSALNDLKTQERRNAFLATQ